MTTGEATNQHQKSTGTLTGKTALVTGASRGLGRAIALDLATEGATIIALGRTVGALEELDDDIKSVGSKATLIPLDLLEADRLDALGPSLISRFSSLDILVGNAAYLGGLSPLTHFKTEEWDKIINTNLKANWQLIRTLHPLLARAPKAIALFITDQPEENSKPAFWGPYTASKAALEALVNTYAEETKTTSITTRLFNPGQMPTNLRRKAFPGEDQENLQDPAPIAHQITRIIEDAVGQDSQSSFT